MDLTEINSGWAVPSAWLLYVLSEYRFLLQVAWLCSKTYGVCIVNLALGFTINLTSPFCTISTSSNIGFVRLYGLRGRAACTTAGTYCKAISTTLGPTQSWQHFMLCSMSLGLCSVVEYAVSMIY